MPRARSAAVSMPVLGEGMDVRGMTLAGLTDRCRQETQKYHRREEFREEFCYEIFRRAICDRDGDAWSSLVDTYAGLTRGWILRHPARASVREDDDFLLNGLFERFLRAIGPERFSQFPTLANLLNYLKLCAHSMVMDEVRRREQIVVESTDRLLEELGEEPGADSVELESVEARDLWEKINRALADETERRVIYLRLALGLAPREVQRREPDRFATVGDVYRIYRNALDRLRRSPEIRGFVE
jgi:DNA-directed RNA polymerase specialized sigma24 family protein